jgi:hypothetical protein
MILNELGADGWELVSSQVFSSKLGKSRGWDNASSPIDTRMLLKRPVEGD